MFHPVDLLPALVAVQQVVDAVPAGICHIGIDSKLVIVGVGGGPFPLALGVGGAAFVTYVVRGGPVVGEESRHILNNSMPVIVSPHILMRQHSSNHSC